MTLMAMKLAALALAAGWVDQVLGVDVTGKLMEYGVLGIMVILLLVAYIRKDRQVGTLQDRLVAKAERDSEKYHELASELNMTMRDLTDALNLDLGGRGAAEGDDEGDDAKETT